MGSAPRTEADDNVVSVSGSLVKCVNVRVWVVGERQERGRRPLRTRVWLDGWGLDLPMASFRWAFAFCSSC